MYSIWRVHRLVYMVYVSTFIWNSTTYIDSFARDGRDTPDRKDSRMRGDDDKDDKDRRPVVRAANAHQRDTRV